MDDVRLRPAVAADLAFLADMLGEAAVWRPDKRSPSGEEAMADPHLAVYLEGWPRPGDVGVVAEDGAPVAAAWYRTYTEERHGYGFVADDVPELSIALVATHRRRGIGRRLLEALIAASEAQGHPALSLSVNHQNPARLLYESLGFVTHGEAREAASTMIRPAHRP